MEHQPSTKKSPAEHLIETIEELEKLCSSIKKNITCTAPDENLTSTQLKLFAEYRQLLKLRFDVLKRMEPLIDEAHFHRAVLSVLEKSDKETYAKVIAALWILDSELNGEDDPGEDSEDAPEDVEEE